VVMAVFGICTIAVTGKSFPKPAESSGRQNAKVMF